MSTTIKSNMESKCQLNRSKLDENECYEEMKNQNINFKNQRSI